ncbi:membrane progestin receptor gamma isoform X1 [Podarcis raffonei]|uniref:membrane progestin receptor gamma isoform X1 n=1 Tax=Podarcis raffonei TaxID=65483 RepID=UPI0023295DE6|nr:membrane progestin receptor gamma isoform X1 [Podarcis raffonei]XP_053220980.1 membrane progestin receptor gamma isoform X1 [Podarcis raffonei]XP_053220981.1 membrane progestin receptor gamma isoform X1 [Podarcis raffonei]
MNTILSLKLPRLLNTDQVPKVFREKGILFGYRHPRSSATDCIVSLFQMTNETVNIWTHFLPAWYFLWKLLALVYALDVWRDSYTWPFLAYMVTCCIYPLTSSIAHTFSTMSSRARHICYFFDYGALALYSLGSAIAYSAYVFPEEWIGSTFHHYYVSTAVLNTVVGTSLSCYSRLGLPYFHYKSGGIERFNEMEQPKFSKSIRTFAFAHPYVFDSIPLFYRLYLCAARSCTESVIPIHLKHTVFACLTCFLFATHLPERLAPGVFDYIGHSHQLFHICGIIGTHFQMEALLVDMANRREWLLAPSFSQTFGSLAAAIIVNLIIIAAFSTTLYSMPKFCRKGSKHKD